jgi:hypothetical protein
MPRANRHCIRGFVWHITHRCHKKEFLLKFARDRRRWLRWLFEAKKRYALIDYTGLRDALGFRSFQDLVVSYRKRIEASLEKDNIRDAKWTESVAVGIEPFVRRIKTKLGIRSKGRKVAGEHGSYSRRESASPYKGHLTGENAAIRSQNEYFWKDII